MAKIYQNKSVSRKLYFVPLYPVKTRGIEASKIGGYEIALTDNGRWKCTKAEYYKISLSDAERFPVVGEAKIDIKEAKIIPLKEAVNPTRLFECLSDVKGG